MKSVKMLNKTKPPVVTVSIVRGKGTPAMRATWSRFWRQIAANARKEAT